MSKPELISVILSTYNMPHWLEKSVWGYACQSHKDFELVIADDGSGPETVDLIARLREQTGLTIKHVWHEDDGFRKCEILNRAIQESAGDYMLFSDGDCIPRNDFLYQHYIAARRGHFLSGGYYKLPMNLSHEISIQDIRSGEAFDAAWLRKRGLPFSHRLVRFKLTGILAEFMNRLTPSRPSWNGNNSSGWSDDIRAANGFDERMRYGGQDREFGERLENRGIMGLHVRYQTLCLHLDHSRGYANETDLQRNLEIRKATVTNNVKRTDHGIRKAA